MIASDIDGNWHKLTLKDVHYIPGQAMNLISVRKAIENAGVQNPDFINLTWVIDDKTFKMVRNNGTFSLDAQTSTSTLWLADGPRAAALTDTGRDTTDWQFSITEYRNLVQAG